MQNTKIGLIIIGLSILIGLFLVNYIDDTRQAGEQEGCAKSECAGFLATMSGANIGLGLLFGLLSLGAYMVFFSKGERALLEYIEKEKAHLGSDEKLRIVGMLLDPNEKMVFDTIREHEGITQQMIRIKTNLSKSTVSEILSAFERKQLISRVVKGKTYSIFLTKSI
ncbi:MAG: MarR family transcriptional regulator [Nanoarchaeota archaeon]